MTILTICSIIKYYIYMSSYNNTHTQSLKKKTFSAFLEGSLIPNFNDDSLTGLFRSFSQTPDIAC